MVDKRTLYVLIVSFIGYSIACWLITLNIILTVQKNSLVKQQELTIQLATIEPTLEKLITPPTTTIEAEILIDKTYSRKKPPISTLIPTSTIFANPTPQGTLLTFNRDPWCVPRNSQSEKGYVTRVIDGDTIEVSIDGTNYAVRYIGIDAPELDQPFGYEAYQANQSLVEGKEVSLTRNLSETDVYGRLLRYVITSKHFVNKALVENGYAYAKSYPPDVICDRSLKEAERMAQSSGKGIWTLTVPPIEPAVTIVPSQGQIVIRTIHFEGNVPEVESDEFAEIANNGGVPVNLNSWRLNADDTGQDFYFPNMTLNPGESCRVYTNEIHTDSCGNSSFGIAIAIWNNTERECGRLYNANGSLVHEYCY